MEALRIQMAAQFDPMLAVATSDLDPLPHQIQAVYGDLLTATTAAMTPTDIQAGRRRSRPAPGDAGTGTNPHEATVITMKPTGREPRDRAQACERHLIERRPPSGA